MLLKPCYNDLYELKTDSMNNIDGLKWFPRFGLTLGGPGGLLAVISARKRYFCPILTIKYSWNHVTTTYVNLSHLLRTILIVWKDFQAFTSLNGGLRGRLGGLFCSEKTKLYYWMILKRCWKALCHQGVTRGVFGGKIQALCLAKMFFFWINTTCSL